MGQTGSRIAVAELDPAVTETARRGLYLDPRGMTIVHEDARVALQRLAGERFDVVVTDVFDDIAIPFHLVIVPCSATRQTVWTRDRSG